MNLRTRIIDVTSPRGVTCRWIELFVRRHERGEWHPIGHVRMDHGEAFAKLMQDTVAYER